MMSTRGRVLMIRVVKKTIFLHVSKYDICNFFRTQSVPNSIGCEHDVSRLREERERDRESDDDVYVCATCEWTQKPITQRKPKQKRKQKRGRRTSHDNYRES